MNAGNVSVQRLIVDSIDCLRHPVFDADIEIVQLGRGRLQGGLTKAVVGGLHFSKVDISLPLRTRGTLSKANLTICMLLSSVGKSTSWAQALRVGGVFVSPPGDNLDAVFGEQTQVAAVSIAPQDIASAFAGEPRLSDIGYWMQYRRSTCAPAEATSMAGRVMEIASLLDQEPMLSANMADFWRGCLVEAFTASFARSMSDDGNATIPSALRVVRQVEDYLRPNAHRAIHVSEICKAIGVTRRTLHRAFHDVLGVGPITFLRHRRLCLIHERLRRSEPGRVHITDVATEFGFLELGRFAHHYLSLFGEYPSQTLYRNTRGSIERPERIEQDRLATSGGRTSVAVNSPRQKQSS